MPKEKPLKPTTVAKVNKIKRLKQAFVTKLADANVKNWKRVKSQADFDGFCEFMGLLYGDKAEQKIAVERSVKYFSVKLKIGDVEEVGKQFLRVSEGLAKAVAEDSGPKPEELQKRLEDLQNEFKESSGATDNQIAEIQLRFKQAQMFLKDDLEKAAKVLEEAAQWISEIKPQDEIEEEDDGEELIDPKQLKKFMKMSKNKPHPFACGIGTDGWAYTMNKPAKKPNMLAKNVKRVTGATKLCFGMATLEGKILVLDLDPKKKPLPSMLRKMKQWLKENKPLPANKVRLMQGGAEVPLEPEEFLEILADYEQIVPGVLSSGTGDTQKIRAVWAFVNEKANAQDFAAARKGLATLDDLLDPAEETEEDSEGEPIPEASPQPSEEGTDLAARLNSLTLRIKAFSDAASAAGKAAGGDMDAKKAALAPRNELLTLVRECKGMISKNVEQAEAMLARIEEILEQSPESTPEGASNQWHKTIAKYEPRVLGALSNLEGDTQKIRATWALVNETANGQDPDFGKVSKLLGTLDKLLSVIAEQKKWTAEQEEVADLYEEASEISPPPANWSNIEAAWTQALAKAEALDFKIALKVVDKLKPTLTGLVNAGSEGELEDTDVQAAWEKARRKWGDTVATVNDQIAKLKDALMQESDVGLQEIAQFDLDELLADFRLRLTVAAENVSNFAGNKQKQAEMAKVALGVVKQFSKYVRGSATIKIVDSYGSSAFKVPVSLQGTLTEVFNQLTEALKLMKKKLA